MKNTQPLSFAARFGLGLLPWLIQALYLPLNRLQSGGIAPALPIDNIFPLRPWWTVPYLLTLVMWGLAPLWAAFAMPDRLYRAFLISLSAVIVSGIICFTFFPTYVVRPSISSDNPAMAPIRFLYSADNVYNALPSGHAYITALFALYWSRWKPHLRPLWWAILLIVLLSTLFTRQHYVLDLVAGLALAGGGYALGLWRMGLIAPPVAQRTTLSKQA
jgi:membrane-associated phospholipid phosphatase